MANSLLNSFNGNMGNTGNLYQQIMEFSKSFTGDPKQTVFRMLQEGKINNQQLQNVMAQAQQLIGKH